MSFNLTEKEQIILKEISKHDGIDVKNLLTKLPQFNETYSRMTQLVMGLNIWKLVHYDFTTGNYSITDFGKREIEDAIE